MPRTSRVLVALASLLAVLAIFAVWADRQLLDDGAWDDTTAALIQDPAIRAEVAGFLVDELFAGEDVVAQLEAVLPPRAAGLAGPAATGLREVAERGTARLLARPRVQELWQRATARAHAAFVRLVDGKGAAGEAVTLDLHDLLAAIQARTGAGGRAAAALPADAGRITVLPGGRLKAARDLVDLLDAVAIVLGLLVLGLYTAAVALARERRREALRACGAGLVAAGAAVLIGRALAGTAIVDALTSSDAVRPAADATWTIATSLLAEIATAVIGYGTVVVIAAWLAGPTRVATRARRALAPQLREARLAYGGAAVLVLLLLAADPLPATHHVVPMLVLCALLALAVRALRRQCARET